MTVMTGRELYEAAVLASLAKHDAEPPKRMTKEGELVERPRPKFAGFDLLPPLVKARWEGRAEEFNALAREQGVL